VHGAHGGDELLGGRVLQQEAARTRAQRGEHVVVDVEGREHHDAGAVRRHLVAEDGGGRLDAVHDGHAHIHEHDVGPEAARLRERGGAVVGLAHHLDVGLRVEDRHEPHAEHRLVVDDEHPDAHEAFSRAVSSGVAAYAARATTRNPPPGSGPCSSTPPTHVMRSIMPRMPCPPASLGASSASPPSPSWASGAPPFSTVSHSSSPSLSSPTCTSAPRAWRTTLLSDSCATR